MGATKTLELVACQAIATNDAVTGTAILPCKVGLFINDIEPNREMQAAGIDPLEDGDGPLLKICEGGDQQVIFDAADSKFKIKFTEPVGGWRWDLSEAVPNEGFVYGWYLTTNAGALLYAKRFPTPIEIAGGIESVYIPDICLPVLPGMFE